MTKTLTYNIPGSGNISALIFNHTSSLIDFLEYYNHITRLRNINQLGRLRDIFPGAHHNRYEYVFLQWALVAEMAKQKGNNFGFSSERKFFGKISTSQKYPSTAEILQCLILLTNIGYCDGTFATNRAWLNNIKNHRNIYNSFKTGLDRQDRQIFDKIVDDFDFYNTQIIFALFLLQRYKRYSDGHVEFASEILRKYYAKDQSNVHLIKIWDVFQSIRKISFLTLDSLYAPVPFSLRITSIVLGFEQYFEDIFLKNSGYKSALDELEKVLQNSVYLNTNSIINTNKASLEISSHINSISGNINSITELFNYLKCDSELETNWKNHNEPDWNINQTITLKFERAGGFIPDNILVNSLKQEEEFRTKIGTTKTRIGMLVNPKKTDLRIALSINDTERESRLKSSLKISTELYKLINNFNLQYKNPAEIENSQVIFTTLLKSIFGWDKRFILQPHDDRFNPFIMQNGKKKTLDAIDKYISGVKGNLNTDQILELQETRNAVNKFGYSGLTFVYIGATKIFSANQNNESAEFDGLIFFPTKSILEHFFYIIEAKNIGNGFNESQKQMLKRVRTLIPKEFDWQVDKLSNKSAIGRFRYR